MPFLKKHIIILHVIGWLFFVSLPLFFISGQMQNGSILSLLSSSYYWLFWMIYVIIFYTHTLFLAPQLFFKKRYFLYILSFILLLASIHFVRPFDRLNAVAGKPKMGFNNQHKPSPPPDGDMKPPPMPNDMARERPLIDIISFFLFIMLIAVSFALILAKQWKTAVEKAAQAETDKANAELSFLKAQINPHFLFNTLNNIYSMAVTKNNETANSIMKLSNIMRYVTDDVNEEYVSLQSEVDCIMDYIELQRLRLGKKVVLDFSITGILDNKKIAPLILMTFIENVFKYGLSNHEESVITIKLFAEEKNITFLTQNKIFTVTRKIERTGIGISNTKKRLEHLYANRHVLHITRENSLFTVQLILQD